MTTTDTSTTKTRTITLTGRAPVKIREDEWPQIASAKGDSNPTAQFRPDYEIDEYSIRVRQHADGRTLVYAALGAAIAEWHQPAGGESRRGGELLTPTYTEADEPETYEEASDLFAKTLGRRPDDSDGDQGDLWSHVCAAPLSPDDGRVVPMDDIAKAIRRVGEECEIPDSVIRACIADLPAEEI